MHTLVSYPGDAIFIKTKKGHDEIAQRQFGLNIRQRRVLIIADGTKNISAIREVIPKDELEEIISFLAEQGFIAPGENHARKAPATRAEKIVVLESIKNERSVAARHVSFPHSQKRSESSHADEPALLPDAEKIRQVKDFMTTTATTYLGLLGADVIHRIERAKGAAQLMIVVGHWHMALQESKQGNRFAAPYLEQVTAALTGKGEQLEARQA
ncbi:MAG: hypothetical protein A3I66_06015 [Burkholderiales bacterium RIFCSPLOWO2_02_FULL_57_36]|nr:MAG: hypothetical protein A3I66_06015 [Burkholderiales bacterium RIFCSPLOWO2_02_FULL_57_36]